MLYQVSREQQVSERILLSKREAARTLSISVRTLDSLIAAKEVPIRKIGRRVLIARQYLEQFALCKSLRH
jgi:excisionase family DNA binding protein